MGCRVSIRRSEQISKSKWKINGYFRHFTLDSTLLSTIRGSLWMTDFLMQVLSLFNCSQLFSSKKSNMSTGISWSMMISLNRSAEMLSTSANKSYQRFKNGYDLQVEVLLLISSTLQVNNRMRLCYLGWRAVRWWRGGGEEEAQQAGRGGEVAAARVPGVHSQPTVQHLTRTESLPRSQVEKSTSTICLRAQLGVSGSSSTTSSSSPALLTSSSSRRSCVLAAANTVKRVKYREKPCCGARSPQCRINPHICRAGYLSSSYAMDGYALPVPGYQDGIPPGGRPQPGPQPRPGLHQHPQQGQRG